MKRFVKCAFVAVLCSAVYSSPAAAQGRGAEDPFTILLSNDDGFMAPGLRALMSELSQIADIVVAAPATEQSGTGHGITYREPIMVRVIEESDTLRWYSVAARPATTVRLALDELMEAPPNLVISGINTSANLGTSTWVSGTVAAAREAALDGLPAFAVSLQGGAQDALGDYEAAARYVRTLIEELKERDMLSSGLLLNINFPSGVANGIQGVHLTNASTKAGIQGYERRQRPRGGTYFWDTWREKEDDVDGTDIHGIAQGYITITPLIVDQTDYARIEAFEFLTQP